VTISPTTSARLPQLDQGSGRDATGETVATMHKAQSRFESADGSTPRQHDDRFSLEPDLQTAGCARQSPDSGALRSHADGRTASWGGAQALAGAWLRPSARTSVDGAKRRRLNRRQEELREQHHWIRRSSED
jgi:hypothetical protein